MGGQIEERQRDPFMTAEHVALDVHWTFKYKKMPFQHSTMSPNQCIFRVPATLKRGNSQAYEPYFFSLGPWHFGGNSHLKDAQKYKMHFLEKLVHRFPSPDNKIRELEAVISQVKSEAFECYGGWGAMKVGSSQEFEKILLLDGSFIIEMLRKSAGLIFFDNSEEFIFSNAMIPIWYHDLFLLENQIPWFVLEHLFERTRVSETDKPLAKLAIDVFYSIFSYDKFEIQQPDRLACIKINHNLDLAWHYLGSSSETENRDFKLNRHNIPCATRLRAAGVKIRRVKSRRILDIKFNNTDGVLEIPSLLIHPTTETIFRNLISFEQCYRAHPPKVTCYAKLLNGLVDTPEDVDLLSRDDIFNNRKDVSHFINKLHNGTNMDCLHYAQLCSEVRSYCQMWWPKWRALFYIHNYFTKPWVIISQVCTIIILVLTILQVVLK